MRGCLVWGQYKLTTSGTAGGHVVPGRRVAGCRTAVDGSFDSPKRQTARIACRNDYAQESVLGEALDRYG
jgi:hypothetical protein